MPGTKSPWAKRQAISCERPEEVAARQVAAASPKMADTITRLRPVRSASSPIQGAARATAVVTALTVRLVARADAEKRFCNSGSSGCVA